MIDTKRHPAAHSGGNYKATIPVAKVAMGEAATDEKQVAAPPKHAAHGCSEKHVGHVKAAEPHGGRK